MCLQVKPLLLLISGQGSLKPSESPACVIRFGRLHENRETSLFLLARFPKTALGNNPMSEEFHRIWLNFYGDAFENFERDFVISQVMDVSELPSTLTKLESVVKAVGRNLYKIQLRYQPEKVVTKHKNDLDWSDPAANRGADAVFRFELPASRNLAALFRSLVKGKDPMTLDVYTQLKPWAVESLHEIKNRLEQEKGVAPFNEYRDKNGNIV